MNGIDEKELRELLRNHLRMDVHTDSTHWNSHRTEVKLYWENLDGSRIPISESFDYLYVETDDGR